MLARRIVIDARCRNLGKAMLCQATLYQAMQCEAFWDPFEPPTEPQEGTQRGPRKLQEGTPRRSWRGGSWVAPSLPNASIVFLFDFQMQGVVYILVCIPCAAPLQVCQVPPRPFSGRGSQDDLQRSQTGQGSPKTALQAPQKLPEDPERPHEASKKPPRGSHEAPRRPQEGPTGLPRGPQEAPKTRKSIRKH